MREGLGGGRDLGGVQEVWYIKAAIRDIKCEGLCFTPLLSRITIHCTLTLLHVFVCIKEWLLWYWFSLTVCVSYPQGIFLRYWQKKGREGEGVGVSSGQCKVIIGGSIRIYAPSSKIITDTHFEKLWITAWHENLQYQHYLLIPRANVYSLTIIGYFIILCKFYVLLPKMWSFSMKKKKRILPMQSDCISI